MNWLLITTLLLVGADSPESVDFDTQVAPILSKAGCNAAACHGSAAGRGGFKLSLFGGDPQADFDAIVHDREGRRIRFQQPEDSLVLAKPGGLLEHEGGMRLDLDSLHAATIVRWIEEGAARKSTFRLDAVNVAPEHHIVSSLPAQFPLRVTARFRKSDGTLVERDVTDLAVYESSDSAALVVDSNGHVTVHRRGRSVLVVRFLSKVLTVRVTAPLSNESIAHADSARANWIDDEVLQSLTQLGIPASPQATDAALLRRVTLDLTGRLPTEAEAKAFAAAAKSTRYEALVDRLLESEAFNDYWCFRLMNLLRVGGVSRDQTANAKYASWIRRQIATRRPFNKLAVDLLTASGDSHEIGPASFYRSATGPRKQAEFISESLMGVRLRCANCHNHPLDKWTQDDYHGLAALLANVEANRVVRVITGREVSHPKTGKAATPRIPGVVDLETTGDGRVELARWLTSAENPYFARSLVNRVWKALMGRGLVEPADDLRDTNPPTHPALLKRLEEHFADEGFQLRPLLKSIAMSAAYQRSSKATAANRSDDRFYSHALVKSLDAEVQIDAICDVTGVEENFDLLQQGTRAIQLFNPKTPSQSLDILGRCGREDSCEAAPGAQAGGLSTRLHLLNGQLLNRKIIDPNGELMRRLDNGQSSGEIVTAFYWRAFARRPTSKELAFWEQAIGDDPESRRAKLEDFVWSVLSSSAFTKNH